MTTPTVITTHDADAFAAWLTRRAPFYKALDPTLGASNALKLHAATLRGVAERLEGGK